MTILKNTAEGGTSGGNVSVANSGGASGDAFTQIIINGASVPGGGPEVTYSPLAATQGTLGFRIILGASPTYVRWTVSESGTRFALRRTIKLPNLPTSGQTWTVATMTNGTLVETRIDASGKVAMYIGGVYIGAANTASPVLTAGPTTYYTLQIAVTKETGAGGNGNIEYKITNSSGTILGTFTGAGTYSTGTGDVTQYRIGGGVAASGMVYDDFDIPQGGPVAGAGNWIADAANAAPTLLQPANLDVSAGGTATITLVGADSDGNVANYTTTITYPTSGAPTLSNATTDHPSFPVGATPGVVYTLTSKATDDTGADSPVRTYEVRVPSSASPYGSLPINGTGVGTWTIVGAQTTDGATLNTALDTDYLESPALVGTGFSKRVREIPVSTRTGYVYTERLAIQPSGGTLYFRVYEGTTLRETFTQVVTASPANYTFTITNPSAIIDTKNLYKEIAES